MPHSNQMDSVPRASCWSDTRGFSIIEVVVAMFVLAAVLASSALVVGADQRLNRRVEAIGNQDAVAQQALDRLQADAGRRAACNSQWTNQEQNGGTPAPCTDSYNVRWPADNRLYRVQRSVVPVDDPADGTGITTAVTVSSGDFDQNTRDYFEASVSAELDPASAADIANLEPAQLATRIDWAMARGEGTVEVQVCTVHRPERASSVSGCTSSAATEPVHYTNNITVVLEPTDDVDNPATASRSATTTGTGSYTFRNVPRGTYRLTVDPIEQNNRKYFRSSPELITVEGNDTQRGVITMSLLGGQTQVCARIDPAAIPQEVYGSVESGWEIEATNIAWRRKGSPVYTAMELGGLDDTWQCDPEWKLSDPLRYAYNANRSSADNRLFQGEYDLEVEGLPGGNLEVSTAPKLVNNTGCGATNPALGTIEKLNDNGSQVEPEPYFDPTTPAAPEHRYYKYERKTEGVSYICIELQAETKTIEVCAAPSDPGCVDTGETTPVCVTPTPAGYGDCPAGSDVTVGVPGLPAATPVEHYPLVTDWYAGGGPNDNTTACIDDTLALPGILPGDARAWPWKWYGSPEVFPGSNAYSGIPRALWYGHAQLGGQGTGPGSYYEGGPGPFQSWHNPVGMYVDRWECSEVSFAGPNVSGDRTGPILAPGAPRTHKFHVMDCLEVNYKDNPSIKIRGRILDVGSGYNRINMTIGGLQLLNPVGPKLNNDWTLYGNATSEGYFTPTQLTGDGLPEINVVRVEGDPICNGGTNGGSETTEFREPMIVDEPVYVKIVDDPAIEDPPPVDNGLETNAVEGDNGDNVVENGRTL